MWSPIWCAGWKALRYIGNVLHFVGSLGSFCLPDNETWRCFALNVTINDLNTNDLNKKPCTVALIACCVSGALISGIYVHNHQCWKTGCGVCKGLIAWTPQSVAYYGAYNFEGALRAQLVMMISTLNFIVCTCDFFCSFCSNSDPRRYSSVSGVEMQANRRN
mmetsp:Transcript_65237/g.175117  ORF Transcript_65237/g.175117 Transcript_65237/m.175117 type:complete len:162 (-) Transcript_65237:97-582(-)